METIYPYGVAKIRIKETKLLSNATLNQMAIENNLEKISSILQEHDYDILTDSNRDEVLKIEEKKLNDLMLEVAKESNFLNLFLVKQDYHNLKTIVKTFLFSKTNEGYLMPEGIVSIDSMRKAIENKDFSNLTENMRNAMEEIKLINVNPENVYKIDVILDKAYGREIKELAEKTNIQFLIDYVIKIIDITNLKMFLRIFYEKQQWKFLEEAFWDKGSFSIDLMEKAFFTDNPIFMLQYTGYGELLQKMVSDGNYDKIGDNAIMDYMKQAKLKALTIEPIIAYWYAKETEIKNVRILLQAKMNKIPSNQIKERLRESYV